MKRYWRGRVTSPKKGLKIAKKPTDNISSPHIGRQTLTHIPVNTHTRWLAEHCVMAPRLSSRHLVRQLTRSSRACRPGHMCVCAHTRTLPCVLLCVHVCVFVCVCVAGVCGDSCSLNSIIVSNWGLPSQCVAVESTLSRLMTGPTYSTQMYGRMWIMVW